MRVLRWIGIGLAAAIVALVAVAVVARICDGPIGPFPGGPLLAGALVEEPVSDWSFAADVPTVEMQLLVPPRSRTTWIVVYEGKAYIPCGAPNFRLWKQWPHEALRDGRALVRIGGRRYPVTLVRVTDEATFAAVDRRVAAKYGVGGAGAASQQDLWVFRLNSRPVGSG